MEYDTNMILIKVVAGSPEKKWKRTTSRYLFSFLSYSRHLCYYEMWSSLFLQIYNSSECNLWSFLEQQTLLMSFTTVGITKHFLPSTIKLSFRTSSHTFDLLYALSIYYELLPLTKTLWVWLCIKIFLGSLVRASVHSAKPLIYHLKYIFRRCMS